MTWDQASETCLFIFSSALDFLKNRTMYHDDVWFSFSAPIVNICSYISDSALADLDWSLSFLELLLGGFVLKSLAPKLEFCLVLRLNKCF